MLSAGLWLRRNSDSLRKSTDALHLSDFGMTIKSIWQRLHQRVECIPYLSEGHQAVLLCQSVGCKTRRRIDRDVNGSRLFPGHGTRFSRPIGKSHDEVEVDCSQFAGELGPLARYIDAHFSHDANGIGMQSVGFDSSRIGLEQAALQPASPSFGHLATTGVAGTKKEDSQHRPNHRSIPVACWEVCNLHTRRQFTHGPLARLQAQQRTRSVKIAAIPTPFQLHTEPRTP